MKPRYELLVKIASGGMAAVYVGRLRSELGFEQLVAIKRPHAHLLEAPDAKEGLMAEARGAARLRHANVVSVRDVEATDDSILLVMDYVEGASMLELMAHVEDEERPAAIRAGLRILLDVCAGLQAVHDLTDEQGNLVGLVHRDISPHNILVGLDGVARLTDFGIAKRLNGNDPSTREGIIKGKLAYMAPESVQGKADQRGDVFSVGVVLWELLTGERLFHRGSEAETFHRLLMHPVPVVSSVVPDLGTAFDAVVARALERTVDARFARAADLMTALESAIATSGQTATHQDVARFVHAQVDEALALRRERVNACSRESVATSSSDTGGGTVVTQSLTVAPPAASRSPRKVLLLGAIGVLAAGGLGAATMKRPARPEAAPQEVSAPLPPVSASSVVASAPTSPEAAPVPPPSVKPPSHGLRKPPVRPSKTPSPATTDHAFRNPY